MAWRNPFSKQKKKPTATRVNGVKPSEFAYVFDTTVQTPQPGPGYHSPLLKFQTYPAATVQDRGTLVGKPFKAFQPNVVIEQLAPVQSGGSGTIHGTFYGQPLVDTSGNGSIL